MADPTKPNLPPVVGEATAGKAVATGAAKAAAGSVAKVAAWHTITRETAKRLGKRGIFKEVRAGLRLEMVIP